MQRAQADGITRGILRLFLPRDGELSPPDESWTGGIMELYRAASPLTRELLRRLSRRALALADTFQVRRYCARFRLFAVQIWLCKCFYVRVFQAPFGVFQRVVAIVSCILGCSGP